MNLTENSDFLMYQRMKLKELETHMTVMIPIIRLSEAKFLIGDEIKVLKIKSDVVLVRVGGGYESLFEYLRK